MAFQQREESTQQLDNQKELVPDLPLLLFG